MEQSVTKNAVFMTTASVAQKIISFVFFSVLARTLGLEDTGRYFFAFSFTGLFVVFVDIGLSNVLVREGARDKNKVKEYVSAILFVKIFFGAAAYLFMFLFLFLLGYNKNVWLLVGVAGVTMLFDSLQLTLFSAARAFGNLRFESFGLVFSQAASAAIGSIMLYLRAPLVFIVLGFTLASVFTCFYIFLQLQSNYKLTAYPKYNATYARKFVKMAVPFALASIFARGLSSLDSVLLSKMSGDAAVGIYSIPVKIATAFQFIPMALTASVYPRMSQYFSENKDKMVDIFVQSFKYLAIIAAPVATGIIALSKDIILSVYTDAYMNSVVPLRILLISMIFSFLSYPLGSFLNAANKQAAQTSLVGGVLLISFIVNYKTIPIFGPEGASIASLLANMLLVLGGYIVVSRLVKLPHARVAWYLSRTIVSALIMGIIVAEASSVMPWFFTIPIGVITYGIMLMTFKLLTVAEIKTITSKF